MSAEITFPPTSKRKEGIRLRKVSQVHIESDINLFSRRAEVTISHKYYLRALKERLNIGDAINIRLGYGAELPPIEFEGYITNIEDGAPIILECEDEMVKLRQNRVSISRNNIAIGELIGAICPGYKIEAPDITLGAYRCVNKAPVEVFEELKQLGLRFYFESKVLHIIDGYPDNLGEVKIVLEKNAISESLNKVKQNEKLYVEFRSLQRNGRYLVANKGEKGGTEVVIKMAMMSQAEIEMRVKHIYKNNKAEKIDGDITLFGIPRVVPGMIVNFRSLILDKKGHHYADRVVKDFSKEGFRQVITLGRKVFT